LILLSKSLVIFLSVGLISGLFFGIYLLDFKNTSQLEFVEGPSISIVTEKFDFKKSETISIKIINSGTEKLIFDQSVYPLKITGLSGMLIFSPDTNSLQKQLEPKEELIVVWDQIKNDGDIATEGLYKISTKAINENGNHVEKSSTITIWT
jgi:hypothetical protein